MHPIRISSRLFAPVALLIAICLFSSTPALAGVYGAIRGTVVDANGAPVADVTVTIKAGDSTQQSVVTGPSGAFEFPRVAFDTYDISAAASDGRIASDVVTVLSDGVVSVTLKLSSKVLGRVNVSAHVATQNPGVNVVSAQTISTLPGSTSLNKVIQTVPGIVPFSYNEPVSRGFHGVQYEIDGVPIPQTTSSDFAEIIDPRDIDRLEVFTGAIPAEFGGERDGAVVDVITTHAPPETGNHGLMSVATGSYGYGLLSLDDEAGAGPFHIFVTANDEKTGRGIDSPTFDPTHDQSSQGDEFVRAVFNPDPRDQVAADFSNQYSGFQIPIDTNAADPNDPCWSPASTNDYQQEYDRSASLAFDRSTADGKGYFELSPWYHSGRVAYLPDPANDLAGGCPASTAQDRIGKYVGLTTAMFRTSGKHSIKVGATGDVENFTSAFSITLCQPSSTPCLPQAPFTDDVAQRGSNMGVYIEDKFEPSATQSINAGVRYDHSTGFVSGNQISPRIEYDDQITPQDLLHFYFGRLYAAPALEDVRRDAVVVGGGGGSGLPVYDLKPEHDTEYETGVDHRFSGATNGTVTFWFRNVWNVLDTTQIGSTPIFTEFNSAYGRADGAEVRLAGVAGTRGDNWYLSYGISESYANGISGGTFLFSPQQLQGATGWALEDHDQTNTLNAAYTWDYAPGRYFSLQPLWGSGFPAQFENGQGRLPGHVTFGASLGQRPSPDGTHWGWEIDGTNLLNKQYLLKLNNGFNTTQYAPGRQVELKLVAPI